MNRQILVGAIFLGIAACTTPGPQMPESSAVAASGVLDENTPVKVNQSKPGVRVASGCKMEKTTGSLFRKKYCLSASQRKRLEEDAQEFIYENRKKADAHANRK